MNKAGAIAIQEYGRQFQERRRSYLIAIFELVTQHLDVDRQFLLGEQAPQEFAWAICPVGTWISAARTASIRWDAFVWWSNGKWHGPHEFFLFLQGCLKQVSILEFLAWIGPEQRDFSMQEQERVEYHQQMIIDAKKDATHAKVHLKQYADALDAVGRILLTISIVPPGALCEEHYDYQQDLTSLVEAFRRETDTPTAAVFVLDGVGGVVSLILPAWQQELTEGQRRWPFSHPEITGYDIELRSETELAALFQRESNLCHPD